MNNSISTKLHQLIWDSDKWTSDCDYCNTVIFRWIKPGVRCIECKKVFHRHCIDLIGPCIKNEAETTNGHNFESQQYYKPTDCDFCKTMLIGIYKQGLQCTKCYYNTHVRCKSKVRQECLRISASVSAPPQETQTSHLNSCKPILPETFSAPLMEKPHRRSTVIRLYEESTKHVNNPGQALVLKEQALIQRRGSSPDAKLEEKYWKLDSKFLHIFSKQTVEEMANVPDLVIPLNEVLSITNGDKKGFNFIVETENHGNFYIKVPTLTKYTTETGLHLRSSWETTIKEAVTAYTTDLENKGLLNSQRKKSIMDQKSPNVERGMRYHIMSEKIIGSGQFGKVYEGFEVETNSRVAVKIIDKDRFNLPSEKIFTLRNEVTILKDLSHPNVVKLLHVFEKSDVICIFMEILDGGDLVEYILTTPEKRISERLTRLLLFQTFSAINYLHSLDIVHCDIKPENILLVSIEHNIELYFDPHDPKFFPIQVKLCDFGYSRIISEHSLRNSLVGTPAYLGPEVMSPSPAYNRSLDLWSAGVCIYVCLTGTFPFDSYESIIEISHHDWKLFPVETWYDISFSCVDLVHKLLQVDPNLRISANQALQHPWFSSNAFRNDLVDLERLSGLKNEWTKDI